MKKIISLCLCITMLFMLSLSVYADSDTEKTAINELRVNAVTSTLQRSLDINFAKTLISDPAEWVTLFDMHGTQYAYYVPLYDSQNVLTGYSVISYVNDDYRVLVTAAGFGAQKMACNIEQTIKSASYKSSLVYEFPDAFLINDGGSYSQISLTGQLVPVTDTASFECDTVEILSNSQILTQNSITTVYGSLDYWDYGGFVPVSVSGGVYYGGYQGWLTDEGISEFWANRSCGVTAASNTFHYMSKHVYGKSNLYTKAGITKGEFSDFQREVYDYISPAIWGIPTLSSMISQVEEYAASRNVPLTAYLDGSSWNATNVRNYIAGGLNIERPVMLLTWNSPIPDLSNHWVTVTRIYDVGSSIKILTSNWAGKTEYDFLTWVNGSSVYKGVIYFK